MAHELNNPIGIIRGYLKTMSPDSDAETLREELEIIDEEAGHCQRIAEELLTYSRTTQLELGRVHMKDLLSETLRRFREGAASKGRDVRLTAEPGELVADASRLRQVILNLLRNAIDAISKPPGAVCVRIEPLGGRALRVAISDTGDGIPPDLQERIFAPFFTTKISGLGMGLSISRTIVEAHGGRLWAEANPNGGTTFAFTLPLDDALETAKRA